MVHFSLSFAKGKTMIKFTDWIRQKLNPAQEQISTVEGNNVSSDAKLLYTTSFKNLPVVNRGVNMLVNACSSLDYDIKDKISEGAVIGTRQKSLVTLLNFRPNPYQSAQEFRTAIFTDFVLEGNVFIMYDGVFMYHLPAAQVEIKTDPKTFIRGYLYGGQTEFKEKEVFHFRDLDSTSIYRGSSRLESAQHSISLLDTMHKFQQQFFDNGAVFGMVLTSENTLSQIAKERTINNWLQKYNAKLGGRRPIILDSGLKPAPLGTSTFKELDFDTSVKTHNGLVLQALGVPPILLEGGNNANISPNLRLFYLETVMPIIRKYTSALERYFGFDVDAVTDSISALQPDIKDTATYYTTLVNGGIMAPAEARVDLRLPPIAGHEGLRIPQNIAGSATNPDQGGRPPNAPKE